MGVGFFRSPIGILRITTEGGYLIGLSLSADVGPEREDELVRTVKTRLAAYFDGKLREFDLPIALGGAGFCRRVWEEIAKVEYGSVITYGQLAARAGSPNAYRSAGTCTGKNPIMIVVPCHRIVARGGIGGFGGGVDKKRFLLRLEGHDEYV